MHLKKLLALGLSLTMAVALLSGCGQQETAEGGTPSEQVIIYSIGGMPVEDVAWGKTVYENAIKMEIGTKLNLWEEPYLF